MEQGGEHGIPALHENGDIRSAIEILTYGLKGMAGLRRPREGPRQGHPRLRPPRLKKYPHLACDCGVNDLPLSMVLSWYEQKAVVIPLTLLHLEIKKIKLGPSLPAFVSPSVFNFLVENFDIAPISTPDEDLKKIPG